MQYSQPDKNRTGRQVCPSERASEERATQNNTHTPDHHGNQSNTEPTPMFLAYLYLSLSLSRPASACPACPACLPCLPHAVISVRRSLPLSSVFQEGVCMYVCMDGWMDRCMDVRLGQIRFGYLRLVLGWVGLGQTGLSYRLGQIIGQGQLTLGQIGLQVR